MLPGPYACVCSVFFVNLCVSMRLLWYSLGTFTFTEAFTIAANKRTRFFRYTFCDVLQQFTDRIREQLFSVVSFSIQIAQHQRMLISLLNCLMNILASYLIGMNDTLRSICRTYDN